ncbi:MAG: adenylate/guanylate cyclase domain-containing protein, partial [Pseudomonadota bacterium]
TRIEGLNKQLATRTLVSSEVLEGLDGFVTREVGRFLLKGKTQAVTLHELVGLDGAVETARQQRFAQFADALAAFREQHWDESIAILQALLAVHPDDGPARYYQALCEQHRANPPAQWDAIVRLEVK